MDATRPYLSGLLARFDEGYGEAIEFFQKVNPDFRMPATANRTEAERAESAATGECLVRMIDAMSANGRLWVGNGKVSIFEGAVGIAYGMFILVLIKGYLKDDGVEIETPPLPTLFVRQLVHLDEKQRAELVTRGLALFQDMIKSDEPNLIKWHDSLSTSIRLWLLSGSSEQRTKALDDEMRKAFASLLAAIYNAMEYKPRKG